MEVSLPNLELDQENARFENTLVSSQREAIQYMLDLPGMAEKIAELASHIAFNGFDPTELPLVIPHSTKAKAVVVVEGNRRVLALKLLQNPNLCPDNQKQLQKKILAALNKATQSLPQKIQCSLVSDRKIANLWIELKHTGENEGAGRVTWDGRATDAFRERSGANKSVGRIILDYIGSDPHFNEDLKQYSESIKITNLNRLFGAAETSVRLGYKITGGKLLISSSEADFRKAIEAIISRFQEDNIKVADIYDSAARRDFFEKRIPPEALPKKSGNPSDYKPVDMPKKSSSAAPAAKPAAKKQISIPPTNLRKRLINFPLRISHPRINAIYNELKNKIDVHDTPNAGSVLFRVFLELSTDHALVKLKLNSKNPISKDDSLRKKVSVVVEKLLDKNKLDAKEAADIKHAVANEAFKPSAIDGLHRYIHGPNHPLATELNDIMDNWASYFRAIWAYDQEKISS